MQFVFGKTSLVSSYILRESKTMQNVVRTAVWVGSAHAAGVEDNAKCIVVTRVCLSVCLSVRNRTPTLLHGPGCNLGRGRGCPLVVHYWADFQSGHGLHCYGNIK